MSTRRISLVRPSDMFRMMEDSMSTFMTDMGVSNLSSSFNNIEVNVKEYGDKYEVAAKVPGFKKDDITLSFEDNMLILEGKVEETEKQEEGNSIVEEFQHRSFKRSVSLPTKVDIEAAKAELKNGVMMINLPKLPEVMPRKITISDAE